MQLGTLIPQRDIGGSPSALREFAQAAESLGYDFLEATDHVLGPNAESRHDPFVMFGFLAGLTNLSFATGVLVITQRQAVLAAKQAASLDILCAGRFRLGVGIGSNSAEFTALNQDFYDRGPRSAEQVQVMQKLWASHNISIEGKWHRIRRRHQSATGKWSCPCLVRRTPQADRSAHRKVWRRLDHAGLSDGQPSHCRIRQVAAADRSRRT